MVPLEQNSVARIQGLVEKFSKPYKLVVDLFFATFRTVKKCLELLRNRHFVSCKVDAERFAASMEALVETNARQVWNEESDICDTDEVVDACMIVLQASDGFQARKWM